MNLNLDPVENEEFDMKSLISDKIDPSSSAMKDELTWLRKESNKAVHRKMEQASLPAMFGRFDCVQRNFLID
jgi:hypothetical protein